MAPKNEFDLRQYDLSRGARGKYLEKARRSFDTVVVDKKVSVALGGPDGIAAILTALAQSMARAKKKSRAA